MSHGGSDYGEEVRPAQMSHGGSDQEEEGRPEGFEASGQTEPDSMNSSHPEVNQHFNSLFSGGTQENRNGLQACDAWKWCQAGRPSGNPRCRGVSV